MKSILFLAILITILIFNLFYSLFFNIIEGNCNYNDGGDISSSNSLAIHNKGAPVKNRTNESCNLAGIYENDEQLKYAREKLSELKNIHKMTKKNYDINNKLLNKNTLAEKNIKSTISDVDSGDNTNEQQDTQMKDDSGKSACDKYPEAC
tara:strand:- start:1812 stop:2261 length:450 start_codon:yes stop_codon:yes gene_type:complete